MAFWNKKKSVSDPTSGTSKQPSQADSQPASMSQPSSSSTADSGGGGGVFGRFKSGLSRTSRVLNTDIRDLWKQQGELVDDDFLKRLFAVLVKSDMGGDMARQIRDRIGKDYRARKVEFDEVLAIISQEIEQTLQQGGTQIQMAESGPTVILVVGVNGSGKTTSIAKLAYRFTQRYI